jgi:predicted nucleic acid-binding protein
MGAAMTNGAVPRVYLDANVFIAAFEHAGASSDHAWWLIRAIEDGEIFAATSELTLAEILVKPLERGQADLADGYGKMLVSGSHFEVMPVQRDILIEAASIRARRNAIRLPDALHVATAKALACGFFISNDRRLALPEGMRLLAVNPFTLDDIIGAKP